MTIAFKRIMTFEQMSQHMLHHSDKYPSKVNVGKYARENGYKARKYCLKGKLMLDYVNSEIPLDTEE